LRVFRDNKLKKKKERKKERKIIIIIIKYKPMKRPVGFVHLLRNAFLILDSHYQKKKSKPPAVSSRIVTLNPFSCQRTFLEVSKLGLFYN